MRGRAWVLAWALIAGAPDAAAGEGRIEISQASVEAAGGFPFVIGTSGSYVLTSDLVVATDVSAIVLDPTAARVAIDLNGFRIQGASSCDLGTGNCPQGSASGIGTAQFAFPRATIVGGEITGFSGFCIAVSVDSHIRNMRITGCGRSGIAVGTNSVVLGNSVSQTGEHGILFVGDDGVYAHNTVRFSGLAGAGHVAISGGKPSAGNDCDDGTCPRLNFRRRYYLTNESYTGGEASAACADGYRIASVWELASPSALSYATGLGQASGGSTGPPAGTRGWAYVAGEDCNDWTSDTGEGSVISLQLLPVANIGPWFFETVGCRELAPIGGTVVRRPAWCVEDED